MTSGRGAAAGRRTAGAVAAALALTFAQAARAEDPMKAACSAFRSASGVAAPAQSRLHVEPVEEHFRRAEALGFNGGALITRGGAPLLRRAYGYADAEAGRRMRVDSVFDIGSVTKQFTAAAILRLEEMGKLRVEDRIGRFFPAAPADKRDITIHQLLTHTAGFQHDGLPREEKPSRDEAVARILATKLTAAPGERYRYSNPGFTLLAAIVEQASQESYEGFLRRELWLPAGMRDTGNLLPRWTPQRYALGYNAAGSSPTPPLQWWGEDGPSWSIRGAGYVLSTMDDLARWTAALQAGRVLSERSRTKLFHPHVRENSRAPSWYGYGWAISTAADGSCFIAHDGGAGFHADVVLVYPEHAATVVLFNTQSRTPAQGQMDAAKRLLFVGGESPLPQAGATLTARERARAAGRYRTIDGVAIDVLHRNGRLEVPTQAAGVLRTLTPFPPLTAEDRRVAEAFAPRASRVLDALHRGDYGPLDAVLDKSAYTLEEEKAFWPDQWARWREAMGEYQGAEVIGHRRAGGQLVTYVLARFADTALPIEFLHGAEGGVSINTVSMIFPERIVLLPQADGGFHSYNSALRAAVRVRLDPAAGRIVATPPS